MNGIWLVQCFEKKSPGHEGVAVKGVPGFASGPSVILRQAVKQGPMFFFRSAGRIITVNIPRGHL